MKKILLIILIIMNVSFIIINSQINKININKELPIYNKYSKNIKHNFVSLTSDNIIASGQDLLNIFYSSLNSGLDSFSFSCKDNYDCLNDIIKTLNNKTQLYIINNLVSPYNSYKDYYLSYQDNKYVITFNKIYNKNEINYLESQIDLLINYLITKEMPNEEKLIIIHDYLINNISYDQKEVDNYKATAALLKGKAICTGYADVLAIILDKLNIPNYRIISSSHVWNIVYINNKWLHIDLTYDDPIKSNSLVSYNYFLVDSSYLTDQEHIFNKSIYAELF